MDMVQLGDWLDTVKTSIPFAIALPLVVATALATFARRFEPRASEVHGLPAKPTQFRAPRTSALPWRIDVAQSIVGRGDRRRDLAGVPDALRGRENDVA